MGQLTISAVSSDTDSFEGRSGKVLVYRVRLEGRGEEVFDLNQMPETDPPTAGQVIEGSIQEASGNFNRKIKKDFNGKGGVRRASPEGGVRRASPEEAERIARSAAWHDWATVNQGTGARPTAQAIEDVLLIAEVTLTGTNPLSSSKASDLQDPRSQDRPPPSDDDFPF